MSIKSAVIIIPTYNEALCIKKTIQEVFQALATTDFTSHILVFDSCSTDNTQNIVRDLQNSYPNLHLQTEAQKTGLGSAYLQAMHYAVNELHADVVVEFDADLSHQPRYLPEMINKLRSDDVVVGSRYVKGGSIPPNWGWHRKFLSVLGNLVARCALTRKYKDFTSGFRATRRSLLKEVLPKQFISNHYAYKLELLWRLHQAKAKIVEYPIEFIDREQGQSKLPANSIIDSLRVLGILRYRELYSYFGMCAVGLVGLSIQCLIYNLLRLKCSPFFAAQIAVSIAILNNFILNNQFTFKRRVINNQLRSAAFFIAYSILMIVFQSTWVQWGVEYLGAGYVKENLIVATGILVGSVLNYLFYSRIVWRKKESLAT
ncbi:glycosyltransferase [Legionella sp. km772]|uniref:glycosyltransferase n=1 Tax=Legionella sp. km772 TaxID=2498111 RepID=UPI00351A4CFB